MLLISSYFFYMYSVPGYGLLILGVTLVSYVSARLVEKQTEKKRRKRILTINVLICLLLLFFFKYFNFFDGVFDGVMHRVGIQSDFITLNIILPVGISFYTFQAMSYVVDVYRGDVEAERHFGKYATFVSFFPQLVAGPIERTKNLLPQIKAEHNFDYDQAMTGVKLMLWGYYKKLVVADMLSNYVKTVYDNPTDYKGFSLVLASVFFSIQIYCDFSGYSDIAIGTAKLFGINLMTNFKSPYLSESIREFWGRWHISLSTWFRDYVYIPLGGSRVGKIRHYMNLMITFLVSGLWHGANWTFVVWGGVHGIGQVIENLLFGKQKKEVQTEQKGVKIFLLRIVRIVLVYSFCVFAWIFFVAHSLSDALYVIRNSIIGITDPITYIRNGLADIKFAGSSLFLLVGVILLIMVLYDVISYKEDFILMISKKKKIIQWVFYIIIGLMVVFFSEKGVSTEFIYFQF